MATPIVTRLPEAPSRQNSAGTFAAQADSFMAALPAFGDQINQVVDHVGDQVDAVVEIARQITNNGTVQVEKAADNASAAAQSAQTAASQSAAAKGQADASRGHREAAQAAAAAAQASAGLPATAGKAGAPLVARPDGGVEFSSSLSRYDLSLAASTALLDLAQSQVFKIDASIKRTLSFANAPAGGRAMTVVLHVTGTVEPTWPPDILWNNSQLPVMGTNWTTIILIWVGDGWVGSVGARS
ncbi:hypothetical protein [Pseudomonas alabamensis]|uniref:hypothetical protein n=1 Tax=Pseudomonas alabamensis TaxID=3064349 RepID=UPI000745EFD3|nr:hypothetical protein APT63_11705 [Pseudomonas monteilii]